MAGVVKAVSYRDQIYSIIKSKILNQEYGDNDVLNERKIAEELQVSRTPVREALKALEADDLVEYVAYKGIVIKPIGLKELREIFQIRKALESLTVELAMPGVTDQVVAELEENLARQVEMLNSNKKFDSFLDLDTEYHSILLRVNPNDSLIKLIANLREKIRKLGLQSLYSGAGRFNQTVEEHGSILEAIKARDVTRAKAAMDQHLDMVYQTAADYLASQQNGQFA